MADLPAKGSVTARISSASPEILAALNPALEFGDCPPASTDGHFDELKKHCSEDAITGIIVMLTPFGWRNRWNDAMASELEEDPPSFGQEHLAQSGWTVGVHARRDK